MSKTYTIKENLTNINYRSGNNSKKNEFIVIHYTANDGDTAYSNTVFFKDSYRSASANYFVDESPIVWCCVKPCDISWHCGTTGTYFHKYCRNSNSIGIELCSRKNSDGIYYFKEETIDTAAKLTSDMMKIYNIPLSNVIRHYDVTHKICPEPFVRSESQWTNFKNLVKKYYEDCKESEELTMSQYEELKSEIQKQNVKYTNLINSQNEIITKLKFENEILKKAIGWDSENPEEPALYTYNDSNLGKISSDANLVIGKLIESGRLSIDENGKFEPLCKSLLRLLIIQNRE